MINILRKQNGMTIVGQGGKIILFMLPIGIILWGAAVIQLMLGFSHGKLMTTGAYGVVRNPCTPV
jgi:hypothetical protein